MPRTSRICILLIACALALGGCAADALRPRRPVALTSTATVVAPTDVPSVETPRPAPTNTTAPTAAPREATATPEGIAATVTPAITLVRPEVTRVTPAPPGATPHVAQAYPAPGVDVTDTSHLPIVVRPDPNTEPAAPGVPAIAAVAAMGFVQVQDDGLVLDGRPYHFIGVNASYLMSDYFPDDAIEPIIRYLAETGGVNVIRLFYQPGKDPARFERLLDLGAQVGIRYIVALQDFYWYKTQTWFDVHYKTEDLPHIREVVPRFRDRPEILMWELMNEPGCADGDEPKRCQQHIYNWAATVSAEIKSLDPHHIVSIGTLSAEGTRYHESNYEDMHELPTVDIISLHRYVGKTSRTEMRLAEELNKPIYIGEAWDKAYKADRCDPRDGTILGERAEKIAEDLEWSFTHGVDGYLVWQHDPGLVVGEDGEREWYCSEFSFLAGDPSYAVMRDYLARIRGGGGVDTRSVGDDDDD